MASIQQQFCLVNHRSRILSGSPGSITSHGHTLIRCELDCTEKPEMKVTNIKTVQIMDLTITLKNEGQCDFQALVISSSVSVAF